MIYSAPRAHKFVLGIYSDNSDLLTWRESLQRFRLDFYYNLI